jgi:hypothetical protein
MTAISKTKERALDIFMLLGELDKKNYNIWDSLGEDQKKEFSALVTMRWMAGTTDQRQLIMLNEIVNLTVFNLPEHRELLMKLLAVCSSGEKKRYSWINYKVGSSKKNKRSVELIAEHYGMSMKDAEDSLRLFSVSEIIELGEMHGLQKDEMKLLKKEVETCLK